MLIRDHSTCTDPPEELPYSPVSAWELEALPQHQQQVHPTIVTPGREKAL